MLQYKILNKRYEAVKKSNTKLVDETYKLKSKIKKMRKLIDRTNRYYELQEEKCKGMPKEAVRMYEIMNGYRYR